MGAGTIKTESNSRRRRTKRARPMSEINVTPFVDVMLVLLIIFMVTAPMLAVGVSIEKPQTGADAIPLTEEKPLEISISADSKFYLQSNDEPIPYSELLPKVKAILAEKENKGILIKGDKETSYNTMAHLMADFTKNGITKYTFNHANGPKELDIVED